MVGQDNGCCACFDRLSGTRNAFRHRVDCSRLHEPCPSAPGEGGQVTGNPLCECRIVICRGLDRHPTSGTSDQGNPKNTLT